MTLEVYREATRSEIDTPDLYRAREATTMRQTRHSRTACMFRASSSGCGSSVWRASAYTWLVNTPRVHALRPHAVRFVAQPLSKVGSFASNHQT